MLVVLVWVVVDVLLLLWSPNEIAIGPAALTFVFTFMARPPYGVVTSRVLVTGLWPLRSAVACDRNDGALRQSTPQRAFSPPAGSMLSGTLPVTSNQDRTLVTAFRSPVTTAPFGATIAGLMFPACYFASFHTPTLPVRTFDSTPYPVCAGKR
jgi:hypothetical protein